jgi:hypothetical protein
MSLRLNNIGLAVLLLLGSSSAAIAADAEKKSSTDSAAIELEEISASEILMQEVSVIGSKFNIKNIAGSAAYLDVQDIRQHSVSDINRFASPCSRRYFASGRWLRFVPEYITTWCRPIPKRKSYDDGRWNFNSPGPLFCT